MDVYKQKSEKQSKNPAYYWRFYFTWEGSLLSNLNLGKKQEHVPENLWEPCCSCRTPGRVAMGAAAHNSCTQLSGFLPKREAQQRLPQLQACAPAFTLCLARLFAHQTFHWADSAHSLEVCFYLTDIPLFRELSPFNTGSDDAQRQAEGREVCGPAQGADRTTKDREEDIMSDRQKMSRNPVLTSHI